MSSDTRTEYTKYFDKVMSECDPSMLSEHTIGAIFWDYQQKKVEAKDDLLRECVWAIIDHVGMVQRSGYDENHFCPAMLKLLNKPEIMQLRGDE